MRYSFDTDIAAWTVYGGGSKSTTKYEGQALSGVVLPPLKQVRENDMYGLSRLVFCGFMIDCAC